MSRGRTRSNLSLSERRQKASELFLKGFNVTDVARKLNVTWETARGYKEWHEDEMRERAQANPQLLSDVLRNTFASLEELDQVRKEAWKTYHTAESKQVKLQALNTIRSAQQDKAKLFGLFGVRAEFYAMVASVKMVQDQLLEFMARELCESDRRKIEVFLASPELQAYMGTPALPPTDLDDEVVEAELVG